MLGKKKKVLLVEEHLSTAISENKLNVIIPSTYISLGQTKAVNDMEMSHLPEKARLP